MATHRDDVRLAALAAGKEEKWRYLRRRENIFENIYIYTKKDVVHIGGDRIYPIDMSEVCV